VPISLQNSFLKYNSSSH